jgi:creatinine amidohydrolase
MGYSIFSETMADMTYQQIEKAAEQKLPVLFPIAVIEEHGPHMCLATDAYLTYQVCKIVKKGLSGLGMGSLIAPPYYWGINMATDGFAGSFTVKPQTMISVLCDLLECLKSWGFEHIFLFSFHGDFTHNLAIMDAARKAYVELGVGAHYIASDFFLKRAKLSSGEPYILVQPTRPQKPSEFVDLHSGGFETSLMVQSFPELVDVDLARSLKSSRTTFEDLKVWSQGGENGRAVTPLGYCGNPADINLDGARAFEEEVAATLPRIIFDFLKGKQG